MANAPNPAVGNTRKAKKRRISARSNVPDAPLSLVEDARGTYMFSSKDMCMIGHIPELTEAGINSFKIEGRVKSAYYTAVTANAYKTELLKYLADKEHYTFDGKSLYELESVSHREYATGFFFDDCSQNAQITQNGGYLRDKAFLATVSEIDERPAAHFSCSATRPARATNASWSHPAKAR